MWSEQFPRMLMLLVMASLLRLSFELSRQRSPGIEAAGSELSAATSPAEMPLAPWQKEAAEKAVRRYAEAQQKRVWRHWNEAMFERA